MPLDAPQEGEALGSRPTPALCRGGKGSSTTAAMPTATTTRSRARLLARQLSPAAQSAQVPSERSKSRRKGRPAPEERSKGGKRRTRADRMREDEEEREAKMRNRGREEEEEEEEEVSSVGSSPLHKLHIPDEMYLSDDSGTIEAVENAMQKYEEKRARARNLPTLHVHGPSTCLVNDPKLLPIRESATKTVLCAAKSVLGLSSSVDGKPLTKCSGFWIEWDDENKAGTILTTARLIRTKPTFLDEWLDKEEYAPHAEVIVQLWDDTTAEAHLLYYQKHYNLAFFRVRVDLPVQLLSFSDDVKCAQEVFQLGRDESSYLKIGHGRVQYLNPTLARRYHYMYIHGTDEHPKYHNGGPVIDLDGNVVGMVNLAPSRSFIPSCILLKCLLLWRKFRCIPRPHLGLKFSAIKLLDPAIVEKISSKCNIDDGLIVEEVSEGSHAEKLRIRVGDVIECFDGEHISTTVELDKMLLSKCEDGRNGLNSKVDIEIRVLHTRKGLWRNKTLTVNVSDDGEVVVRGSDTLTREGISASVSLDQMGPGRMKEASMTLIEQGMQGVAHIVSSTFRGALAAVVF